LLSTLPQAGDLIVHDEHVHASAHDGMRLGRARRRGAHNDAGAFAEAILAWRRAGAPAAPGSRSRASTAWTATARRSTHWPKSPIGTTAILLIDEAHATGVFGPRPRPRRAARRPRECRHTAHLRQGLGCEGALVCGPAIVRDFLVNRGRSFIFSTAPRR
jgi:8-amino-7-oxononanoate synthase